MKEIITFNIGPTDENSKTCRLMTIGEEMEVLRRVALEQFNWEIPEDVTIEKAETYGFMLALTTGSASRFYILSDGTFIDSSQGGAVGGDTGSGYRFYKSMEDFGDGKEMRRIQ